MNKSLLLASASIIVIVILGLIIDQLLTPTPPYRLVEGTIEPLPLQEILPQAAEHNQQQIPGFAAAWRGNNAKINFANEVQLKFTGELALDTRTAQIHLLKGTGEFATESKTSVWKLITRAAILEISSGVQVEAQINPIPAIQPQASSDDGQQLSVKVNQGQVAVISLCLPRNPAVLPVEMGPPPQVIVAGQTAQFTLQAVRHQGKIKAVGLGELGPQPGGAAKAMQKRAADLDLRRNLEEFSSGIHFVIPVEKGVFQWGKVTFGSSGSQSFNLQPSYQALTEKTLMSQAEIEIEPAQAVARRNCKVYYGSASAEIAKYKNLSMAILAAKQNAIFAAIKKAFEDLLDPNMPPEVITLQSTFLQGTFYPESYTIQQKDNTWVAEISGEVLFK